MSAQVRRLNYVMSALQIITMFSVLPNVRGSVCLSVNWRLQLYKGSTPPTSSGWLISSRDWRRQRHSITRRRARIVNRTSETQAIEAAPAPISCQPDWPDTEDPMPSRLYCRGDDGGRGTRIRTWRGEERRRYATPPLNTLNTEFITHLRLDSRIAE